MRKLIWLCPIIMVALAAWAFKWYGFSILSSILIALLLVCPAIILWGVIRVYKRPIELPVEKPPHTRGMSLDWAAPVYDFYCPKIGLGRAFRSETLRLAKLKNGEHVLDVGCGTGVLTRLAAEAIGPEGRAFGIDPGVKMIAIARKSAKLEGSRAEFRLGVIENLPFEDSSFDCVLSSAMIHHLPPDLKVKGLSEVRRVLKPGGRLVAVDIGRPTNPLWWALLWPLLLWHYTKDHLSGRLDNYFFQAGFSKVDIVGHWMGLLTFWLAYKK